jgi:demethylmenaquinone methyltransferase/2-methoxy-6-polyprenyl-1,4-benzoquinol methylase
MNESTTDFGYQSLPINLKTARVAAVFHSVAKRYDVMNDLMSLGLHHLWKRRAIARLAIEPYHSVLDLACGTGDLSRLMAPKLNGQGKLALADINDSMLNLARERLIDLGLISKIEYIQTDAECLPFPEDSFHRVIIGFGLRNVTRTEKALAEIFRVLKPGGRLVILEFSHPCSPGLSKLYDAYSFSVLPILGKVICDDAESYRYLAESIRMHPTQQVLKEMMEIAHFERVNFENIHDGIVAIHTGFKF